MSDVVFSGHQPNFLPYMGFFYKMFRSDVFVLDDDVQYSSDGWHNTNFLKVGGRRHRITIPVSYSFGDPINEVRISYAKKWKPKLLSTVEMNYRKYPHFEEGIELLKSGLDRDFEHLADLNIHLLRKIADGFSFRCKLLIASKDLKTELRNNQRNIWQCEQVGGTVYLSGDGGAVYNDEGAYARHGIELRYSEYKPVVYRQADWKPFAENLSVLDYILNRGFQIPEEWRDIQ